MSIGAWWEVQKTVDFKYLINKRSIWQYIYYSFIPIQEDKTFKSSKIWEKVHDTYIQLVGIGEMLEDLTEAKRELHGYLCERVITGDRGFNNFIKIAQGEIDFINKELNSKKNVTNEESIIILEEQSGLHINVDTTTVLKYNALIKYYTDKMKLKTAA